jgi:hypothetical protein
MPDKLLLSTGVPFTQRLKGIVYAMSVYFYKYPPVLEEFRRNEGAVGYRRASRRFWVAREFPWGAIALEHAMQLPSGGSGADGANVWTQDHFDR